MKNKMLFGALKKAGVYLLASLGFWLLVSRFASVRAYSGYLAALMGACYLLAAWLQYLKSKGVDYFAGFRKRHEEVPYYLRSEKEKHTRITLNGNHHQYDDDLQSRADEDLEDFSENNRHKFNAAAFALTGVVLLIISQFCA